MESDQPEDDTEVYIEKEKGATGTTKKGEGFSRNASVSRCNDKVNGKSIVTCPGNILSDISRLEVLIGGKRAGNNSAEIINEAADICRRLFRLFTGGIMDIRMYRELINELAENHRDAHGFDDYGVYSD